MTEQANTPSPPQTPSDEIDLIEYARVLWRWRILTAALTALFVVCAVVYALVMPPAYLAEVTVLPVEKPSQPNLAAFGGLAASFGLSVPVSDDPSAVYGDIIKSRDFLRDYVNDTLPTLENPQGVPVRSLFGIETSDTDSSAVLLWSAMRGMVDFGEDGNISVLSVTSEDPVFAAALANDIVVKLETYNKEKRNSKIQKNREFIEERLSEMEKELRVARDRLSAFRKKHMRLDAARAPHLLDRQEWLLQEVRTKQEIYLMLKKEYEMARIEEEKDKPYMQILDLAIPPRSPFKPKKKLLVALGAALGFFAGIFLSFFSEFLWKNSSFPPALLTMAKAIRR